SFTIRECPVGCDAWVAAVCDGHYSTDPKQKQSHDQAATPVAAGRLGDPLSLVMRPVASMEVHALGPDGQPAEGVKVTVSPETYGATVTTYGMHAEYYPIRKMAS